MKVFEILDNKINAKQAAQAFGNTFEVPRKIKFIGQNVFRFIGGVAEYEINMIPNGFEIYRK
jgi:hypothetical protein